VYTWTAAGGLAASLLTPLVSGSATGWGLNSAIALLKAEGATGPGLMLGLTLGNLLLSTIPGLLSLFLVAVADTRLELHPVIGGLFCGVWAGWIMQSPTGAAFGFIFGGVSLGGTAAMLALNKHLRGRA
jgi:hypothetical protein